MPKNKTTTAAPAAPVLLTITQVRSGNGCTAPQQQALKGLGLRRIGSVRQLQDTPAIRGLVRKVHHLVTVTE
jgi:large subunit ribosomal protein L30